MREVGRNLGHALVLGAVSEGKERGLGDERAPVGGRGGDGGEEHGEALRHPGPAARVHVEVASHQPGHHRGRVGNRADPPAEDELGQRLTRGGDHGRVALGVSRGGAPGEHVALVNLILGVLLDIVAVLLVDSLEERRLEGRREGSLRGLAPLSRGVVLVESLDAVEEREVTQRAGGDGTHGGAIAAERRAEHADALAVIRTDAKDDTDQSEASHGFAANGG